MPLLNGSLSRTTFQPCFLNTPTSPWLSTASFLHVTRASRIHCRSYGSLDVPLCHNHQASSLCAEKGVFIDLDTLEEPEDLSVQDLMVDLEQDAANSEEALKEWRSKHWVVLIDDEPSIRLAIGDFLHSMGYKVVTACDGPSSFLEMLLWTCGWSFLDPESLSAPNKECPPWLEDAYRVEKHPWRLPSIVISDIRMPGGIDGVQLLELFRENRPKETKKTRRRRRKKKLQPEDKQVTEQKTKGRKKEDMQPEDEEDDAQIIDPGILEGWVELAAVPIATPVGNARTILDKIHNALEYCKEIGSKKNSVKNYPQQIQDIPVILLTAKALVSDRIKGYEAGADGYLPKPFRPEELIRMIDNLMRRQEREKSAHLIDSYGENDSNDSSSSYLTMAEIQEITTELREIKKLLQTRK